MTKPIWETVAELGAGVPPAAWDEFVSDVEATLGAWQSIETAPEGRLVVVGWLDNEDDEPPERHDFDWLEDGCWTSWHDHAEHAHMIGGHGVSDTPPYTHWLELPAIPKAPNVAA